MSYGPSTPNLLTEDVLTFMRKSSYYVNHLSLFDRYILFRYTYGSASVNTKLIMNKVSDNAPYWTYLFFQVWHNTTDRPQNVSTEFTPYVNFFNEPQTFNLLSKPTKMEISGKIIDLYISKLQKIIMNGPVVEGEGINVYKVASKYPGIPNDVSELPARVVQLPFNSTTINKDFNFYIFTNPLDNCCFFQIYIPRGQHCLFIPSEIHAYPFEAEVILPTGCIFNIQNIKNGTLKFVDPKESNMVIVQDRANVVMGPVFQIDTYRPCGDKSCTIQSKSFNIYETVLS